jgi:hypothetical protein
MSRVRDLLLIAALSFATAGTSSPADDQQQQALPTRDVDVTYQITWPDQPAIVERRRWSTSARLERVDGSDKSISIFDRNADDLTLLNLANHTYRKLASGQRQSGEKDPASKRVGESVVAGFRCLDWTWMDDTERHTACLTSDSVLLRLVVNGRTVMQATSVSYQQQPAELFQVPQDYEPALAPEGGAGDYGPFACFAGMSRIVALIA